MRRISILAGSGLLFLVCNLTAVAEAPKGPKEGLDPNWSSFWDDCYDLNLPYFQSRMKKFVELLKTGDSWEKAIEIEKIQIDKLNTETCKNWSVSKNGEEALKELTTTLMTRATTSNDLAARGTSDIGKQLEAWMAVEQKELDEYGFKFEEFPCGKAFKRTHRLVMERVKDIVAKAETIKTECNKSIEKAMADSNIKSGPKAGVKQTYGKGSGVVIPKGTSVNGASDISGVDKAMEDEKKSEEKIRQQEADAAAKNKKKKKAGSK